MADQEKIRLLGYEIKLAQHALHRRMEDVLRPHDLTPAQYAALVALGAQPDQTNAELADRAFITPQSMQGVLARLEAADLVERRQDLNHGRRQLARLTQAGRARLAQGEAGVAQVERALEAAVAPLSLREALAFVERLHRAMAEMEVKG